MPTKRYQEIEIPSSYPQAKQVEDCIVAAVQACGYKEEDVFALRLSLEEALSNAIRHGNVNGQKKGQKVNIRYYVGKDRVDIFVADEGQGFDPTKIPDPTSEEKLECPNGRGIMLMRAYMNLVEYNDIGNVVHMVMVNSQDKGQSL